MSLLTRTDVTAVKLLKNYILIGIGSAIHIYSKGSTRLLSKLLALNGQKIYSFVPSKFGDKILVYGGKQFTVVSVKSSERKFFRLFDPIVCDDWLHSAVWIDNVIVALLTAHNVVEKWNTATMSRLAYFISKDNSILYSGLLLSLNDDILVMAGTVFSEVIIHNYGDLQALHNLKGHKGVIFSISCKPENHIIVTTSDDRSLRIWGPNNIPAASYNCIDYWKNINIVCKHEVYGHLARVMKSCILDNIIISVGEDSAICYWNYEGKLLRKSITHQNGCIWTVDSDDDHLITGGGDCGVILHPISIAKEYSQNEIIDIDDNTPRKVEFTARRNLVIVDECKLIYYDTFNKIKNTYNLNHVSTYQLLSLSTCKQLIAIADMTGILDIFVENCKEDAAIIKLIHVELNIGKVLSMHWAGNRHLVFCTDKGNITVLASKDTNIEKYANFMLPACKEALLTAAAVDYTNNYFVLGDRCGNIHVFIKGQRDPIKSFSKVHGRYGPRSLIFKGKDVVSTGRDHSIKYYSDINTGWRLMYSRDLPFAWVEKFLDKDENIVCGFQERVFIVYNIIENNEILRIDCGGGHRSFDAVRYIDKIKDNYEEIIKLVYLKNSEVNIVTFELNKIMSRNIINGSHAKEINCLVSYKLKDVALYISGGEDTTLRISSVDAVMNFKDEICFKNLSSVRTLKINIINDKTFLLISAGGRAQICVKKVKITNDNCNFDVSCEELIDYQIKGTDKDRKGNQSWSNCCVDFDPEMRVMDIDIVEMEDKFIVFAGCSDAYLRIFSFNHDNKKLSVLKEIKYHKTCILKTKLVKIINKNVLVTCTTRGDVAFWDVTNTTESNLNPYFKVKTNKSGINSLVITTINDNKVLLGTGGDDNAINLVLLEIKDQNNLSSTNVLNEWKCANYHSSQITGLCLVENYLLSASIDQRITLIQWKIQDQKIQCKFLCQVYTDIADVQGMDLVETNSDSLTVCVFGKGMEVIVVPTIR